jgi:hypothetical protein
MLADVLERLARAGIVHAPRLIGEQGDDATPFALAPLAEYHGC